MKKLLILVPFLIACLSHAMSRDEMKKQINALEANIAAGQLNRGDRMRAQAKIRELEEKLKQSAPSKPAGPARKPAAPKDPQKAYDEALARAEKAAEDLNQAATTAGKTDALAKLKAKL